MATVVMPQLSSHLAIASRSAVKVGKTRTGFSSRSAGTATKISRAPMSIPAAFGSRTGRSSSVIPFLLRFRLLWPVSQGLRPAKLHENKRELQQNGKGTERRGRYGSGEVETVGLSDPERAGLSE